MTALLFIGLLAVTIAALMWWATGSRLLAAALIVLMIAPLPAAAGTLDTILTAAVPGVLELVGVILTGIIGWAATRARAKWGIEIEARHREALQSALLNGARLAMDRQLTGKAAIDLVLTFIRSSVPDAIGNLKASPEVLTDLARAKLEQAAAEKARDVTGAAVDKLADALRKATG